MNRISEIPARPSSRNRLPGVAALAGRRFESDVWSGSFNIAF